MDYSGITLLFRVVSVHSISIERDESAGASMPAEAGRSRIRPFTEPSYIQTLRFVASSFH